MALHPSVPLEPQHRYRVEAKPVDLSADGSAGEAFVTSFTTSSALLEPLALTGELSLSLRGTEVDIVECGPCGNDCSATGKRRALLADVQVPAPSGGQGVYRGVLHFSDHVPTRVSARDPSEYEAFDQPHDVHLMQFVAIKAGEVLTLRQEVYEEGLAYAGCFTFVVWDPAGHVAQTSTCLPSLSADDIRVLARDDGPVLLSTDEDIASDQVRAAEAGNRDVGCNVGASRATIAPAWLALVLTALLARSSRRQRDLS